MNFFQYLAGSNESLNSNTSEDAANNEIYNSFLTRLTDESSIVGGPFLYREEGHLQNYLREVEDAVLLYLVLAEFDLIRSAAIFVDKAHELIGDGLGLQLSSFVYSNSPISKIRSSIRIVSFMKTLFLFDQTIISFLLTFFSFCSVFRQVLLFYISNN